jgi:hypothetical protein
MFGSLMGSAAGMLARVVPAKAKLPLKVGLTFSAGVLIGKYASVGYFLAAVAEHLK